MNDYCCLLISFKNNLFKYHFTGKATLGIKISFASVAWPTHRHYLSPLLPTANKGWRDVFPGMIAQYLAFSHFVAQP